MKYVLITGASSGIGKSTAELFYSKGYSLVLMARRVDLLLELKKQLISGVDSESQNIHCVQMDICDLDKLKDWFNSNLSLVESIEILINNAGLAKGVDKVQESKIEDWRSMIDTNINGLVHLTRFMLPYFIKKNSGFIVNMGSVAGRWSYSGGSVYCGTKHFVKAFSESLRQDLLGYKIRVCNIEPGMVETEFSEVRLGDKEKAKNVYKGLSPLRPEDIAKTILWCVEQPAHVNIQELVVFPTAQASVSMVHRE